MARIVLGIGTSHSPMLTLEAQDWPHRAAADVKNPALNMSDGRSLTYAQLLAETDGRYEAQASPEVLSRKAAACQAALDRLADAIEAAAPDVVVIVGDDQEELFTPANQPAFAIFHGDEVVTYEGKYADAAAPQWMKTVGKGFMLDEAHTLQGSSGFATELIERLMDEGVEVSAAANVVNPRGGGVGHAYGFIVNRLFKGRPIPIVPVLLNTYFPPNVPSASRCYDLGMKLRKVIEASPRPLKVAVVASGGLSHFVVDEELDRRVMHALEVRDVDTLRSIPRSALRSGSSETLNWVLVAGAVEHLPFAWGEYQPVYRTPAGTGVGVGFCLWRN